MRQDLDLLRLCNNLLPSDSEKSTSRKLINRLADYGNPPPSTVDDWSLKMILLSTLAAALRPSIPFQRDHQSTAIISGGIPSAHDSYVVLNMFAFSFTLSVMFLRKFPKGAAVFRSCANMCMLLSFVILAYAVSSLNVYHS